MQVEEMIGLRFKNLSPKSAWLPKYTAILSWSYLSSKLSFLSFTQQVPFNNIHLKTSKRRRRWEHIARNCEAEPGCTDLKGSGESIALWKYQCEQRDAGRKLWVTSQWEMSVQDCSESSPWQRSPVGWEPVLALCSGFVLQIM